MPEETEARARWGLLLDQLSGNAAKVREQALNELEKVLRREPQRASLRRRVVGIAVALRRFADALAHLKVLQGASPGDGALYHLQGHCEEILGHHDSAAEAFRKAVRHPPRQIESYERLAWLLARRPRQVKQADEVMDALVQEKQSFQARLARARYLRQRSLKDALAKDELLRRAGDDLREARLARARYLRQRSLEALLPGLRQGQPGLAPVAYLEARLLAKKADWLRAIRTLEQSQSLLVGWPDLTRQADLVLGECYEVACSAAEASVILAR